MRSDGRTAQGNEDRGSTANTAIRLERIYSRIKAIEEAKKEIPEEYIKGVWQNILYAAPFPHDAGRATYSRYKSKFVYEVAKKLSFL